MQQGLQGLEQQRETAEERQAVRSLRWGQQRLDHKDRASMQSRVDGDGYSRAVIQAKGQDGDTVQSRSMGEGLGGGLKLKGV